MKKQVYFLILFIIVAVSMLTGCGGGSSDTNDNLNPDDTITGIWYVNYEQQLPVYANKSGNVDHLIIKSDGTYKNYEYGHELINYDHYVISDYDPDVWPGTWKEIDGVYYLTEDSMTNTCIYNKEEGTFTMTQEPNSIGSPSWVTIYKKTHKGKYQE